MEVDCGCTQTELPCNAAGLWLPPHDDGGKRKRDCDARTSSTNWQNLAGHLRRLLQEIIRAEPEGNLKLLPGLLAEQARLMRWEQSLTELDKHRE